MNVEHGNADGESGDLRVGRCRAGAFDKGDVGGSASHVEGDDAVKAAGAGSGSGADHASSGTGEDGAHGLANGGGK